MPRDRDEDDEDDDRPRRRFRRDEDDEDDDRPRRPARRRSADEDSAPRGGSNGLATMSLVFGVLSFCTGITFIPGLICGFMGLSKAKTNGVGKGVALAGILTSLVGIAVSGAAAAGGYFLYVQQQNLEERMVAQNNFKQLGNATHNNSDATGYLPKPYLDESRRDSDPPLADSALKTKLSWRVTLLPYLEQASLYTRFQRSEAWDSPANKPLSQTVVRQYADTDTPLDPATRIRCFYDNGAIFESRFRTTMIGITDGTSNTILYVEGGDKATWSQFNEYKFDPNGALPALGHPNRDTFTVLLADGSSRQLRKSINPATLKALITRAGGEVIGDY